MIGPRGWGVHAVYLLLAAALLLPGLISGPSLDAAVFTVSGIQLTEGATLYVDTWDHKPPGIYLLYAALQVTLGWLGAWPAVWLFAVVVTGALGSVMHLVALRVGIGRWAARLAGGAAVLVAGQYLFALGGGLTEPVAALAIAAALLLALDDHQGQARTALVGLLLAASVLVSLQTATGAPVVAVLAVARRPRARRAAGTLALVAGAALPIAAVGAWLVATGAASAAIDANLGYPAAYRAANASVGAELSSAVAAWSTLALVFLVLPAGLGISNAWRRGGTHAQVALASVAWLVLAVAAFVLQGRFIAHYVIPLAVPLATLAGMGLDRMLASGTPRYRVPLATGLAISLLAGGVAGAAEWRSIDDRHRREQAVAEVIRQSSGPDDTILVWGNAAGLHLAADRDPAGPHAYLYPLTTPGYSTDAQVRDSLAHLERQPPAFVVDAGSSGPGEPGFLPLLEPRPVATDGRDLDLLDPLRDFVRQRYRLMAVVEGWPVYALR